MEPENNRHQPEFVFFWKKDDKNGIYCQWWMFDMTIDEVVYNCCEQYMMAMKAKLMGDLDAQAKIMREKDPRKQQSLGRKVKNWDQDLWDAKCLEIVTTANYHKFTQDKDLKKSLLLTNNKIIVEASPVDVNWGIGYAADHPNARDPAKWRGKNLLGEALMAVRKRIREEEEAKGAK